MSEFISPTKGKLTLEEVVTELKKYAGVDPEGRFRIYIGTDSKVKKANGMADVEFVTAIVILRIGHGGRYFWTRTQERCSSYWRQRIFMETYISLQWTQKLIPILEKIMPENEFDLEIHIDAGENGPTKAVINEAIGMVVGSGFAAKTKPDSFAASIVADRYA